MNFIWNFINGFFSEPCLDWIPIETPPEKGERVLVKCSDGGITIGCIDTEADDLWIAFTLEVNEKIYKFNIKDVVEWKPIPN